MPVQPPIFDSLPDNCLGVLYGLVTSFPGKGKTSLLKLLRTMGVPDSHGETVDNETLTEMLEWLKQADWVVLEKRPEAQYLSVAPARRNQVLLSLLRSSDREQWLHEIKDGLPPPQRVADTCPITNIARPVAVPAQ
jgi:hypothetical protein